MLIMQVEIKDTHVCLERDDGLLEGACVCYHNWEGTAAFRVCLY